MVNRDAGFVAIRQRYLSDFEQTDVIDTCVYDNTVLYHAPLSVLRRLIFFTELCEENSAFLIFIHNVEIISIAVFLYFTVLSSYTLISFTEFKIGWFVLELY